MMVVFGNVDKMDWFVLYFRDRGNRMCWWIRYGVREEKEFRINFRFLVLVIMRMMVLFINIWKIGYRVVFVENVNILVLDYKFERIFSCIGC